MEYEERLESIISDVKEIIQDEHDSVHGFLMELFNLLFWKDYAEGYLTLEEEHELANLFNNYTKKKIGKDEWYSLDDIEEVREVIKKVRKKIGIQEKLP